MSSIVQAVENVGGSVPGYTGMSGEMVWLKSIIVILAPLVECAARNLKGDTEKGTHALPIHPNAHSGNPRLHVYLFTCNAF